MWVSRATILLMILLIGNGCATRPNRSSDGLEEGKSIERTFEKVQVPQQDSSKLRDSLKLGFHVFRSQVVEPINRPFSYVSRFLLLIGDTTVDTSREMVLRAVRIPALEGVEPAPLHQGDGMDLSDWESQLDKIVGDHRSFGKIELLIDGDEYFPALAAAIKNAKSSIKLRTYIFDMDDVSLAVADQLKGRSAEIEVDVMFDGLGTLLAQRVVTDAQPANKPAHEGLSQAKCRFRSSRQLPANPWPSVITVVSRNMVNAR